MLGIFDSGSGGLTVARAIRRRAPRIDIVYFGDVQNAPYGDRDRDALLHLTIKGLQFLRAQGAQNIVSACNSVSAAVIRPLGQLFGSQHASIVEMVGPAATAAAVMGQSQWVGVATPATVQSGIYQHAFEALGLSINMIPCESLAGAIEFGSSKEEVVRKIEGVVKHVVTLGSDRLLLGCTHYPLVQDLFEECLRSSGSSVQVFDPADAVACEAITRFGAEGSGVTKVFTSRDTAEFRLRVNSVFGTDVIYEPVCPEFMSVL